MNEDGTMKKRNGEEVGANNLLKRSRLETTEGHVDLQKNDFSGPITSEGAVLAGNVIDTNGGDVHFGGIRPGIFKNYLQRNCWLKLIFDVN
jgi:hypothetical protein